MISDYLVRQKAGDGEPVREIGYYPSLDAAEAAIRFLRLQPAHRDFPDDFSIEEISLDRFLRFANTAEKQLLLIIEPSGTPVDIPPGSRGVVHYSAPHARTDESHIELREDEVIFWCEGATFEVEIDGRFVTSDRPLSPTPDRPR